MSEPRPTDIQCVFFDWDLTLARSVGDVTQSERLAFLFQGGGFSSTHLDVQQAIETYRRDLLAGKLHGSSKPPQTQDEIIQYYVDLLRRLGYPEVGWEEASQLYHAYALLPTRLYDDAQTTLRALQARGIKLGLISNHTTVAREMMEQLIGNYVTSTQIIISEEVGQYKPAEAIYEIATDALQVTAEHCIFVGDNLEVDAIGAVRFGRFRWGLWLDRDVSEYHPALPSHVVRITSLTQVLDYL